MKPPIEFHESRVQQEIIRGGTREQIIEWLCWNDPNGCYTDRDSEAEGYSRLTRERVVNIMRAQMS